MIVILKKWKDLKGLKPPGNFMALYADKLFTWKIIDQKVIYARASNPTTFFPPIPSEIMKKAFSYSRGHNGGAY